jgi:hypothetical protein
MFRKFEKREDVPAGVSIELREKFKNFTSFNIGMS